MLLPLCATAVAGVVAGLGPALRASRPDLVQVQRLPGKIRALFEELSMEVVLSHASLVSASLPEEMEPLQRADADVDEQGARVLSAHEALSSLSEENRELFLDVVESLQSDLGHGKAGNQ